MNVIKNTSKETQRIAILSALRGGSKSTIQFREEFGICSPAPRVQELRKRGYEIATTFRDELDSAGVKHRIGVYTLINEPDKTTHHNKPL
ncbi:helix-turn-helix domain-containing protein [Ursidibacter sp. B-7004-1]